jgi:prepilin-type processing-associated H-X9-DG protein
MTEDCRDNAIRDGALWPYCKDLKLYHCPSGYSYELRNYTIVDGMNGRQRNGTKEGIHWIKKMEQIRRPTRRAVFIDEGWITPDSFAVHFQQERWWDSPPVRHSDGTTLSFTDGHTEHWKWKGPDTIAYGTSFPPGSNLPPTTPEGRDDLHRLQIAVWGELGYMPP